MNTLNLTHDYFNHCDVLHQKWFDKTLQYEDGFEEIFQVDYSPEPYFILKNGSNPLFMLLTNPGAGMDFQKHDNFVKSDYRTFARTLGDIYTSEQFKKEGGANAHRRLTKSIKWADHLGYDAIVNIETIPFHSPNLNKSKALEVVGKSWILSRYQEVLRNFLADKPVLIVAACSSKTSISIETIKNSNWLMYQTGLANINVKNLKFKELTKKNGKVSSALLYDNEKHIVLMMGSNNLPSIENI
tara:strand:- start:3743 stop:4471 length:729 start_codon:yes stop_codon:yes gene_type:complete